MTYKKIMVEKEILVCDYCKTDETNTEQDGTSIEQCVVCGKHSCLDHRGDDADDGSLCKECTDKGCEFKYDDGCVWIEQNGKGIDTPYL